MSKIGWTGQLNWETRQGGKRLSVVVAQFLKARTGTIRWAAIAVEAPADADSLSEILRKHSHADIGDYETVAECVAACDEYIDRWLAGSMSEAACACTDVELASREADSAPDLKLSDEIFEEGFWRSCSGCHESNEGHPTGPYSDTFRCHLGSGCRECGGIGAIWEQVDEQPCCPRFFSGDDGRHDSFCRESAIP